MSRKEELEKIRTDAMAELRKIEDSERAATLPQYVGKFFADGHRYYFVTRVTRGGWLAGWRIGLESDEAWFNKDTDIYYDVINAKPIPAEKFWAAYDKAMAKFLALRK